MPVRMGRNHLSYVAGGRVRWCGPPGAELAVPLKTEHTYPSSCTPGRLSRETDICIHTKICTQVFVIATNWKQPSCSSKVNGKQAAPHPRHGRHSAVNRDELPTARQLAWISGTWCRMTKANSTCHAPRDSVFARFSEVVGVCMRPCECWLFVHRVSSPSRGLALRCLSFRELCGKNQDVQGRSGWTTPGREAQRAASVHPVSSQLPLNLSWPWSPSPVQSPTQTAAVRRGRE